MASLTYHYGPHSGRAGAARLRAPARAAVARTAARQALRQGSRQVGHAAAELEAELEWESGRVRRGAPAAGPPRDGMSPRALMEHYAHAAVSARTDAEAEAFVGAMVPLAARLLPSAAPAILRTSPSLIRGLAAVTRTLRGNPRTRPLIGTLPTVLQRTVADLGRRERSGRPVTVETAVRSLSRQTGRVLGSPAAAGRAMSANASADRRFHRRAVHAPTIAE